MSGRIDIVAAGYPSLDRIIKLESEPRTGFTSIIRDRSDEKLHYGGCNINIAYTAARLGLRAMPACFVGDDFKSSGFESFLREGGVMLDAVTEVQGDATSRSYLVEDKEGNHITLFYPGAMNCGRPHTVDDSFIDDAKYCVITVGEPQSNLELAKKAVERNVPLVFGMKCDFNAFSGDDLSFLLKSSAVIFMNEHEREVICDFLKLRSIEELFGDSSCRCIVTTMGDSGSKIIFSGDGGRLEAADVPLIPADCVSDTSGVGDAYIAGFLAGLVREKSWYQSAVAGAAVASFIVEGEGCLGMVPDVAMVNKRIQKYLQQEIL